MKQHAICILGILVITIISVLAAHLEPMLFDTSPPQLPEDLTMEQWKESFEIWAFVCVGASVIAIFIWYLFAGKVIKTNYEIPSGKRGWWLLLFVLPAVAICLSIFLVEETESTPWLAYLCFVVNGLVPYYLATVLFSPTSVKYTPLGAMQMRRFW